MMNLPHNKKKLFEALMDKIRRSNHKTLTKKLPGRLYARLNEAESEPLSTLDEAISGAYENISKQSGEDRIEDKES